MNDDNFINQFQNQNKVQTLIKISKNLYFFIINY